MQEIKIFNQGSAELLQSSINLWITQKTREANDHNAKIHSQEIYFEILDIVYGIHRDTGGELFVHHAVILFKISYY